MWIPGDVTEVTGHRKLLGFNPWSQKSRAITNLKTRFEEFESLPHRQLTRSIH
jgi:hypothetical protein